MDVREKLVELLTNAIIDSDDNYGFPDTNQVADRLIVNGVTVVVRCKDCKHYRPQKKSAHWESRTNYCNRIITIKVQPDDFCSYGERKDGDDNG